MREKIHCIAFVMDSCTLDVFPSKVLDTLKRLQQKANQRGMFTLFYLKFFSQTTKVKREHYLITQDNIQIFNTIIFHV